MLDTLKILNIGLAVIAAIWLFRNGMQSRSLKHYLLLKSALALTIAVMYGISFYEHSPLQDNSCLQVYMRIVMTGMLVLMVTDSWLRGGGCERGR